MKTRKGFLIKRGGTFYAVWNVKGKRFVKTTGQTVEKDAKTELARIMQPFLVEDDVRTLETVKARLEGTNTELIAIHDAANPPLTLSGAWAAFIASQKRPDTGKATLAQYEISWGRFWQWMKDNHPAVTFMRDVTPEIAGQFAGWLTTEGRSPNTFNKYMNVMALVFRTVKEAARLTGNPWEDIQRKKLDTTHGRRELTIEELRKVAAAATGDLRVLFALGIYTGLRLGDCATLRWVEADLARGRIVRIPNKTGRSNPKPVTIPLHPALAAMLAEIPEADRTGYVLPRIATDYARHSSYVTDRVQVLIKSCGIQTTRAIEGRNVSQIEVGFHSLRHSFVSLCRAAGAPLSVVEAIVGHSSPAMTQHYTHTGEAAARLAIGSLPGLTADNPARTPAARLARLLAKAEKLTPEKAKRALLRLLTWHHVKKQD